MKYIIEKVITKKQMNDFVKLPRKIYKDNPYYVPDMDRDIRDMFNWKKNPGLRISDVQPFIAYSEDGEAVGRICGIINHKANNIWHTCTVRFGLIEFIDDEELSAGLLKAVEDWGCRLGMDKIEGPMGITDFDKEGMLIEDFDQVSSAITLYNHPYYPQHMVINGFEKQVDWVQARFDIPGEIPSRYTRVSRLVGEMYGLKVRKLTKHEIFHEGYAKQVFDLLNICYKPLFGFSELSPEQCHTFLNQYYPLVDLRMIPVVEDQNGKLIAAAITIGSLSEALIKSGGRFLPLGWYHLIKSLKIKHEDKAELLLIAVHPDFQGLGVNALIFEDLIKVYNELGYKWAETGPMLESNLKVLTQWKPLHPKLYKRRRCWCKKINREIKIKA